MSKKKTKQAASRPPGRTSGRGEPLGRPAFLADGSKGTRLQKFHANAGVDSRRNCEEFITGGRVTVDGEVVTNPAVSVHPAGAIPTPGKLLAKLLSMRHSHKDNLPEEVVLVWKSDGFSGWHQFLPQLPFEQFF